MDQSKQEQLASILRDAGPQDVDARRLCATYLRSVPSQARLEASQANGKKGGRPKVEQRKEAGE